jgi:hypothetical protein
MGSPPRLRVIGLVVGGAAVALAAGFFLLTRGQSSSSASSTHTVIPLSKRAGKTQTTKRAAPKHRKAVKKPARRRTPKPIRAKLPAVNGVPGSIAAALTKKRVVVVALYAPRVELDQMAMSEARAGALAAGAGFVALDVLDESQSRPLTEALGVLEDPSVLVYRRPAEVVVRFTGFTDQQTIFQAARNARL